MLLLTWLSSSRQAIQKYIRANNDVGTISDNMYKSLVNRAISTGEEKGEFTRPKGMFFSFIEVLF